MSDIEAEEDEEAEERFDERMWEPVGDLEAEDLPDPLASSEEDPPEEPWAAVSDLDAPDDAASYLEADEEQAPDPWGPIDTLADPLAELPVPAPPVVVHPSMLMPPMHEWGDSNSPARQLPWRTTARVIHPDLGELVCIADPSAATSQLLVASWEWQSSPNTGDLVFRVADDGPEYHASPVKADETIVQCELELAGEVVEVLLQLVSDREQRGLRLGRDLLGHRFLVDPSRDELETE